MALASDIDFVKSCLEIPHNIEHVHILHTYIKENDIDEMVLFFRKMNSEFIDMVDISDSPQDIAIDFHNVPYYGDKNTKGVVGIQPKNGNVVGDIHTSRPIS